MKSDDDWKLEDYFPFQMVTCLGCDLKDLLLRFFHESSGKDVHPF